MQQDRGEVAVWRWLDGHINRETGVGVAPGGSVQPAPALGVIEQLLHTLGQPQRRVPAVLVAGTNGKTTTARILSALLQASTSAPADWPTPWPKPASYPTERPWCSASRTGRCTHRSWLAARPSC